MDFGNNVIERRFSNLICESIPKKALTILGKKGKESYLCTTNEDFIQVS